jgi:hypothetical protein
MDWIHVIRIIGVIASFLAIANFFRVLSRHRHLTREQATARAATAALGGRPPAPKPSFAPPVKPPPAAAPRPAPAKPLDGGAAGHLQRALASTAKMPAQPPEAPKPAASAAAPAPAVPAPTPVSAPPAPAAAPATPSPAAAAVPAVPAPVQSPAAPAKPAVTSTGTNVFAKAQATRLEELGFHVGIESDSTKPAPAQPRTHTAELSSILDRIDQFLADDPRKVTAADAKPAAPGDTSRAEATPTADIAKTEPLTKTASDPTTAEIEGAKTEPLTRKAADAKKGPPAWARPDSMDEDVAPKPPTQDGTQQKLF